jgi:hypothetical protein
MPSRTPFEEALDDLLAEYEDLDPEEMIPVLEAAIERLTAQAEGGDTDEA